MTSFRPLLALRLAARGLRRSPLTTALAVGILALGLSLPAVFFSLLVGAIRPLPVPDGREIVRVDVRLPSAAGRPVAVTGDELALLADMPAWSGVGGSRTFEGILVDRERAATRFAGAVLTPGVLPLLRVQPALGRVPGAEEWGSTVLLGRELVQEMYGDDGEALGRTVEVDGTPRTVVGILPEGFGFPFNQNLWVLEDPRGSSEPFEVVARLAAGGPVEAVEEEATARWRRADALRDPAQAGAVVDVEPYTGGRGESGEGVAFLGLVLVALALLAIACANVANLLLVRATERVRSLGIQAALGAGRAQVGGQLLLESFLVALLGGGAGLVLAWIAVGVVQDRLAVHFGYFWMRMAVDGPVLFFIGALVLGTALLAGTLPVVRVLRIDVHRVLKEEGAGLAVGGGGGWSRAFVTIQLALSCAALAAAGLTASGLRSGSDYGASVPSNEILVASLDAPAGEDRPGLVHRSEPLTEAMRRLPGVREVALARAAAGYFEPSARVEVDGGEAVRPDDLEATLWNAVTPSYLPLMELALLSGRPLAAADHGAEVALVSESFARRHFGTESPLGRRVRLFHAPDAPTPWYTVVGVVEDAPLTSGPRVRHDRVYLPLAAAAEGPLVALVRARGPLADAVGLGAELRRAVASVDPGIAVSSTRSLADGHAYMVRIPRALAGIAVAGGLAGLLVAAVGLYGLLSFRVRQRRRELGLRMALGADAGRVVRDLLGVALRQILPGLAVGLALAWVAAPILSVMLLGADPRSPATFAGVAAAFLGVGLLAALLPALRAAEVDPARVLRGE